LWQWGSPFHALVSVPNTLSDVLVLLVSSNRLSAALGRVDYVFQAIAEFKQFPLQVQFHYNTRQANVYQMSMNWRK